MILAKSCPTLCNHMDCSSPGSSISGILQAIPFSRESSLPSNWNWVSCIESRFFTIWAIREAPLCVCVFCGGGGAVLGLSYSTQDLQPSLRHVRSLVSAWELFVLPCGIWFPDQGLDPGSLNWEHRVLATGALGNSWYVGSSWPLFLWESIYLLIPSNCFKFLWDFLSA